MLKAYFEISLGVSSVILLLLIFRPYLYKRYSAKCRYIIWIAVAVMLIIPLKFNFTHQIRLNMPIQTEYTVTEATEKLSVTGARQADLPVNTKPPLDVRQFASMVWLVGVIAFILYHISGYALFCKRIKPWCAELSRYNGIRVTECRIIKSPMLIGFFNPKILLPHNFNGNTELALKHEFIHFKRGDLWINLLFITANALHWFNPLLYVMRRFAKADMEYSCDEAVIRNSDLEYKKEYSHSILKSVPQDTSGSLSTYFRGDTKHLKNRIANIISEKQKKNGTAIALTVSVCLVICSGLIGCTGNLKNSINADTPKTSEISRIWFDDGSDDAYDTVKTAYTIASILRDGEEQLEVPSKCIVYQNERLGLMHTCINAATIGDTTTVVQPWGIPENTDEVPYSDIVRNDSGYYGQFVYWVIENTPEHKRLQYEPFYAQMTFDSERNITLRSDDDKYVVRLDITE